VRNCCLKRGLFDVKVQFRELAGYSAVVDARMPAIKGPNGESLLPDVRTYSDYQIQI
jgi:hypothetical protein